MPPLPAMVSCTRGAATNTGVWAGAYLVVLSIRIVVISRPCVRPAGPLMREMWTSRLILVTWGASGP